MIKNYIKIAWRNLSRNKGFTITNLLGLTIGITCAIFIFLWVNDELMFDKFNTRYKNIYQVIANRDFKNNIFTDQNMVFPLAKSLETGYPQIKNAVMSSYTSPQQFEYGQTKLKKDLAVVGGRYFDMFTCKFIKGNPKTALLEPNSLVLTESTAKSFFGDADPINKAIKINDKLLKVTAVIADMPGNSTRQFEALSAFSPSDPQVQNAMKEWQNSSYSVYIETATNPNIAAIEKAINKIMYDHNHDKISTYFTVPMNRWHLYSDYKGGKNTGGQIEYVRLFTIIAIIILLIACVNFMNLSTARSEKRAKEVGIRKTLGSGKKQLITQFYFESLLLSLMAFALSIVAVYLLMPSFNSLVGKRLSLNVADPVFLTGAFIIILFTGVMAGSYPALYLSSFNPVKVLKGTFAAGKSAVLPRRILVVGQFVISIFLIAATLIIYKQIQHVKDRDMGYNSNNLIMLPSTPNADKNFKAIKNDMLKSGLIKEVTRTSSPITDIWWRSPSPSYEGMPTDSKIIFSGIRTDVDFTATMGIKLLQGKDFAGTPSDSASMMLNKAAVEAMHVKNPVGMQMHYGQQKYTVIGVIDNVVMTSPYAPVDPLMVYYGDRGSSYITVRLKDGIQPQKAIDLFKKLFAEYSPADIFEYQFVDKEFGKKFIAEELISSLTNIFAGLAIFICCIGLAGLASFTIEKRFREIGIRKVLGATVKQLLMLIATEFLKLVLIAFVVAVPLTWWMMHNWLQKYTYHIDISIWMFGIVGVLILLLTMVVVSLNTLSAATANPVKSLRSE
ncbi:ABC transporter permease [Mucilaginibacter sp.]|uniref:ABC transporter permease n=1 Tax=Mucilaginibacter sp. TaxID=1882438 RepID=UPI0025CFD826|nr:ABC transporter permease [Mucilaginibacter sp.]